MSDGGAPGRVATPSARQLPKSIGGYRIVDRIGKGAMGVVYSALDEQNARRVAIKVMMTDLESDPETRERFYREAKIAGRLQHRNLISVYDMGEEDGRLYMVMELLKGDTRLHVPDVRGPGCRARARHLPSRHQAGEHLRAGGRQPEGARLRRRAARRFEHDGQRLHRRNA